MWAWRVSGRNRFKFRPGRSRWILMTRRRAARAQNRRWHRLQRRLEWRMRNWVSSFNNYRRTTHIGKTRCKEQSTIYSCKQEPYWEIAARDRSALSCSPMSTNTYNDANVNRTIWKLLVTESPTSILSLQQIPSNRISTQKLKWNYHQPKNWICSWTKHQKNWKMRKTNKHEKKDRMMKIFRKPSTWRSQTM